jgi:hypothetical protein
MLFLLNASNSSHENPLRFYIDTCIYVNSMLSCVRNQMSMLFMYDMNVFLGHCTLFKENYPFIEKIYLKKVFIRKAPLRMLNVLR